MHLAIMYVTTWIAGSWRHMMGMLMFMIVNGMVECVWGEQNGTLMVASRWNNMGWTLYGRWERDTWLA